jgi:myo-inositol-1(or 4)-monophosphatase
MSDAKNTDLDKSREIALKAAKEAAKFIASRVGQIRQIDYKSAYNIVTDVDKGSEAIIIEIIRSAFPNHTILAEEGGGQGDKAQANKFDPTRRWLIDPLDGTTNFTHAYPFFAVSIGLEIDGEMQIGVVLNPTNNELFFAQKGHGAFLNDEPIKVSNIDDLAASLLATGFPADTATSKHRNIEPFTHITNESHGVRRDGSAALDLCFVACGRLDGFWEMKLAPWDVAAGSLIVNEAGGQVSNLENGKLDFGSGHILATNKLIHDQVVAALKVSRSL